MTTIEKRTAKMNPGRGMDILVRRDARLLKDVDNSNISSPAPPCCEQAIEGMWTVRIDPRSPKLEHAVKLPDSLTGSVGVAHDLTPWDTWKELPGNFSGLLDYTMTVTLPALEGQLVLDPGKVNHFAEVWVNGKHVGAKLWPPHKFQTDAFRPGSNEMRIRVGNLVNNNYKKASPLGSGRPGKCEDSHGGEGEARCDGTNPIPAWRRG